jgi:hypothetical protein
LSLLGTEPKFHGCWTRNLITMLNELTGPSTSSIYRFNAGLGEL